MFIFAVYMYIYLYFIYYGVYKLLELPFVLGYKMVRRETYRYYRCPL